jgi:MOSC domain-containing protein YiiM
MTGRLIGIARARALRAPLEEMTAAKVSVEAGIEGDARGTKPKRQITVLFREGWGDACRELGMALPWTARRANLLVEGFERPRSIGGRLRIGEIELEVMLETDPCMLMERTQAGLKAALTPDWRGGVCCNVLAGGTIRVGDAVS